MVDYRMGLTVAPPRINALEAFQQGRDQRREADARNALAQIVRSRMPGQAPPGQGIVTGYAGGTFDASGKQVTPSGRTGDPLNDAWGVLAQNDPEAAFRLQGQIAQQDARAQDQRRADLPLIGRLLDMSTDEASYQRARGVAQQYGIDVSQLPPAYDPAWVQQQRDTVKLLADPAKAEALSTAGKIAMDMGLRPGTPEFNAKVTEIWKAEQVKTIPYTAGGGVAGYNTATGETQTIIAPNPGGYAAGTPVGGGSGSGGVQEGATATNPQTGEKIIFRNGQWQALGQGGGGGRVTSNFLDGL